jgi:hypothetical protein
MTAKELAEVIYDLMRSAPIPCMVNGEMGRAAFFDRGSQKAQLVILLEHYRAATPADELQRLRDWKESAMKQLAKSEKLMEVLPPKYWGWDVYDAAIDCITAERGAATKAETCPDLRPEFVWQCIHCSMRVETHCDFHINQRPICTQCNAEMAPWHSPAPAPQPATEEYSVPPPIFWTCKNCGTAEMVSSKETHCPACGLPMAEPAPQPIEVNAPICKSCGKGFLECQCSPRMKIVEPAPQKEKSE